MCVCVCVCVCACVCARARVCVCVCVCVDSGAAQRIRVPWKDTTNEERTNSVETHLCIVEGALSSEKVPYLLAPHTVDGHTH